MDPRDDAAPRPLNLPFAELERELIATHLAGAGHDLHTLMTRNDAGARMLLADAARHATRKLCEIEARSHYVRELHGEP